MLAKLAKSEQILREYKYSCKKGGQSGDTIENSLIVTNKRIVSESAGKKSVVRKEIPLNAAEYITTQLGMSNGSLVAVILFAILGLALIITGAVKKDIEVFLIAGIALGVVCWVIAIIFLITFFKKRTTSVTVVISGMCGENNLMSVASSTISSKSLKSRKIKISVDREVATNMVNEIGAIIIDAKAGIINKPQPVITEKTED